MAKKAFLLGVNSLGLRYARTDVSLMQECLEMHNYEIIIPPSHKTNIIDRFDSFIDGVSQTDTVIFYYTGHGFVAPNGVLRLALNDNLQSIQNYIGIDYFTNAFEECDADNKLIILDCCKAGVATQDWQPHQSDSYRILTASDRFERSKEIDALNASFLTHYIYKGLTEDVQEIADENNEIRINKLYDWLREKASQYENRNSRRIPIPNLLGNQKGDFLVSTIENIEPAHQISSVTNDEDSSEIYHNLPAPDYSKFIGRESDLEKLFRYISPEYRQHITIVEGIGGVGKTALVLEAAYHCLSARQVHHSEAPIFDAIIFTSAKQTFLTPSGVLRRPKVEATLHDIFRAIALTLDDPTITRAATEEQQDLVYQRLSKQPTLLIIDNVETLEEQDRHDVLSFLGNLPSSTQAIITTRVKVAMYKSMLLGSLSEEESLQLVEQQVQDKDGLKLTLAQAKRLFHRFGGIPIALIYAVGQRAMGYPLKRILSPSVRLPKDVAHFCFEGSVRPLRGQPAHWLLMSLSLFQLAPSFHALAAVAGLATSPMAVEEGLAQLQQLSLVREEEGRYSVLPITREYALAELAAYPSFEEEARERWVEWYLKFTQKHGGDDWQDWRVKYDNLAKEWDNIASVLYWCAAQERYEDVKSLWQNVDNYVDLEGNWRTRRRWWQWLLKESDRRADLPTYVKALVARGWTLTLMRSQYKADAARDLEEAWKLRQYVSFDVQAQLATYIAVHRMDEKQYHQAREWLNQAKDLLGQVKLDERSYVRHQMWIVYNLAQVNYWQENYGLAHKDFQWAVQQGEKIGWQRLVNYAQNWLAEISILQGNLQEAEDLLTAGLAIAQESHERRRVAHYQAAWARLEKARVNYPRALEWAKVALEFFNRDGMEEEAREMQALIETWIQV